MAIVKTPNPNFYGCRFGLRFNNGQAETDNQEILKRCADYGYTVEGEVENVRANKQQRGRRARTAD